MGSGASIDAPIGNELIPKIESGGMEQTIVLELLVKNTLESGNRELTQDNLELLKTVVSVAAKNEGMSRTNACCVIRNISTENCNKKKMLEPKLGLLKAFTRVLNNDRTSARVHACCALQNLATVDANRLSLVNDGDLMSALLYTVAEDLSSAREHSCATLWNIACSMKCREKMMEPRLFQLLTEVVNGNNSNARGYACGALWNLSNHPKSRAAMLKVMGNTIVEALVSILHSDHGSTAVNACGTLWNISLDNETSEYMSTSDVGLVSLLMRIVKREQNEKFRYFAVGTLRSLSRNTAAKWIMLRSSTMYTPIDNTDDTHLSSSSLVDIFSCFTNILKECLADIAMYSQSGSVGNSGENRRMSNVSSSPNKEKGTAHKRANNNNSGSNTHCHDSISVADQICSCITNMCHSTTAPPRGHANDPACQDRDKHRYSVIDANDVRLIVVSDSCGFLNVISDMLHYSVVKYGQLPDEKLERLQLLQEVCVSTCVALSTTNNELVIHRLLRCKIHVGCMEMIRKWSDVVDSNVNISDGKESSCHHGEKENGNIPDLVQSSSAPALAVTNRSSEYITMLGVPWSIHHYSKLGNLCLNYMVLISKHFSIATVVLKQSKVVLSTLILLLEGHRPRIPQGSALVTADSGAVAHADDIGGISIAAHSEEIKSCGEYVKIALVLALIYGRDENLSNNLGLQVLQNSHYDCISLIINAVDNILMGHNKHSSQISYKFGSPNLSSLLYGLYSISCSDSTKRYLGETQNASCLLRLYKLLERIMHIYIHRHTSQVTIPDGFADKVKSDEELVALHVTMLILLQLSFVNEDLETYRAYIKSHSLHVVKCVNQLVPVLNAQWENDMKITARNHRSQLDGNDEVLHRLHEYKYVECLINMKLLLHKIGDAEGDPAAYSKFKEPVDVKPDVSLLGHAPNKRHIMAVYYSNNCISHLSLHKQHIQAAEVTSCTCPSFYKNYANANDFVQKLRTEKGYDIWTYEDGSSLLPSLPSAIREDMDSSAVVEAHLVKAAKLSSLFLVFISPESKCSPLIRMQCEIARKFVLESKEREGVIENDSACGNAEEPSILFVVLDEDYCFPLQPSDMTPMSQVAANSYWKRGDAACDLKDIAAGTGTGEQFELLEHVDFSSPDGWVYLFMKSVNQPFNLLKVQEISGATSKKHKFVVLENSQVKTTVLRKYDSILTTPASETLVQDGLLQYYLFPQSDSVAVNNAVDELVGILRSHPYTVLTNTMSEPSASSLTGITDYNAAWSVLRDSHFTISYDDTTAALTDLDVFCANDLKKCSKCDIIRLSHGLKTKERSTFVTKCGFEP